MSTVIAPGGLVIETAPAYDGGPVVGGYPVLSTAPAFNYPTHDPAPAFEYPTHDPAPAFEYPGISHAPDTPSAAPATKAKKAAEAMFAAQAKIGAPAPWWIWALVAAGVVWIFRK